MAALCAHSGPGSAVRLQLYSYTLHRLGILAPSTTEQPPPTQACSLQEAA